MERDWTTYVKLHVLADKLGDLKTANMVVDWMMKYSDDRNCIPDKGTVKLVWRKTPEHSPLRQLLVDLHMQEGNEFIFEEEDDDVPFARGFLLAFAKRYRQLKKDSNPDEDTIRHVFAKRVSNGPKCQYHQHDASCPECKKGKNSGSKKGNKD